MNESSAYLEQWREERIGGEWVAMAPALSHHNRISHNLTKIFDAYLDTKDGECEYFPDGEGVFLEEGEEYIPDGMVVCDPSKVGYHRVNGAPDLVIEILSPSSAVRDRGRKKDVYERHGVREYWIINPFDKSVEQYVLEGQRFSLQGVCQLFPPALLAGMGEDARAALPTEFRCGIYPELSLRLEDIFRRVNS